MSLPDPGKIHALVVDDFSSFRSTMMSMLNKLGVKQIEEAGRGFEVLKWCKDRKFDLILCDYNLGSGKNGQHLLEELRFRKMISRHTLFVMVTAEASKDMVLSAYDCEPDDYLMKPLNLRVLEQRVTRLIQTRDSLAQVYQMLNSDANDKAVEELKRLVQQRGRHTLLAQKLLGETLIRLRRLREAETLYRDVLENRRVDWAVLGLAKVHYAQGDKQGAKQELRELTQESRLFLPAHDEMSQIFELEEDYEALQANMEQVVELSPKSILRQRKLAQVAENNGDVLKTLQAANDAMKLGEHSCHQDLQDALTYLSAAGNGLEINLLRDQDDLVDDTKRCLEKLMASNRLGMDKEAQAKLLMARIHALSGHPEEAKTLAKDSVSLMRENAGKNVDVDLAYIAYLNSLGQVQEANAFLKSVVERYEKDPQSMEKLDKLLPEPRSEANRRRVAQLNKTGIELYKDNRFDEAMNYFNRATLLYPRHVGLQLNRLQTLIGKAKALPQATEWATQVRDQLQRVEYLLGMDQNPAQQERLQQLRERAQQVSQGQR
jgi:DNA-binding NarL/FixJ family response regulator